MRIIIGGRYEFDDVVDVIGRGGMGTVYLGIDQHTQSPVAIKQLSPDLIAYNDRSVTRFMREADVLRRLHHPYIIRVYDALRDTEQGYYLVMEYINDGSLWDELQSYRQLPIPRAMTLAKQIASALAFVHENHIIHRDIKPANVLIAPDKSPRLSDFGLVYMQNDTNRSTVSGVVVGTIHYLSPEALNGDKVTTKSDIWSFGVMLYEMLAGKRPFSGDNITVAVTSILTKAPADLLTLRPDVPIHLADFIYTMLSKDSAQRPASMTEVIQHLDDIAMKANITTVLLQQPKTEKIFKRVGTLPILFGDDLFYDREDAQASLTNALHDYKPLIAVYGRGGIGKTALVCKVLNDYEKRNQLDGAIYLRADTTPPLNLTSLLNQIGALLPNDHPFQTTQKDSNASVVDKTRALLDGLHGHHIVVYVDNLETLQNPTTSVLIDDDLRQFFDLILEARGGGALSFIITSRYPLALPNKLRAYETAIRLDDGLPIQDAITFLRDIDKDHILPSDDAQLGQWAQKVGGFPRGLEALVGYLYGGANRRISDLLQDETLFRGEVLSNVVHQAHDALPSTFRQVLAGVAVIGQATTRLELDYLLTPYIDSSQLRDILERLTDARFIIYNRQTRTYSLHPIDQQSALTSLLNHSAVEDDSFTSDALHQRMADYYLARRKPKATWKSLDDVQPQLREFEHRLATHDYDTAATLLLDIDMDYLQVWGHVQLVIDLHLRLEDKIESPQLIARSARSLGYCYWMLRRVELAIHHYERGLAISHDLGDTKQENNLLMGLGGAYHNIGQETLALDYYQQSLKLAQLRGDTITESTTTSNIGLVYREMYAMDEALAHHHRAIKIAEDTNDIPGLSIYQVNLGLDNLYLGRYDEAIHAFNDAIYNAQQSNAIRQLQSGLGYSALCYWFKGELSTALDFARRARLLDVAYNNHRIATIHAMVAFCAGEETEARETFEYAIRYSDDLIARTDTLYEPHYTRAMGYVGLWLITQNADYLPQARTSYQNATRSFKGAGWLKHNRQWLETILVCAGKSADDLVALLRE
mgnify:CR=1 FL=1